MKTKVFTLAAALLIGFTAMAQKATNELNNCEFDVQITNNNQVVVRQTNATGKTFKICIYNDEGVKVNTQKYTSNGNFKAVYNVTELNSGVLTFKILCNNKVIYAESLTKLADGSLSIPQQIPLKNMNKEAANELLYSEK